MIVNDERKVEAFLVAPLLPNLSSKVAQISLSLSPNVFYHKSSNTIAGPQVSPDCYCTYLPLQGL